MRFDCAFEVRRTVRWRLQNNDPLKIVVSQLTTHKDNCISFQYPFHFKGHFHRTHSGQYNNIRETTYALFHMYLLTKTDAKFLYLLSDFYLQTTLIPNYLEVSASILI